MGDDLMNEIDSKIIKAMSYERRIGLLTGFGRYLLSRYENNPTMKDSLIQLADLFINFDPSQLLQESQATLTLLCDLYHCGIHKDKIKPYIPNLIDVPIKDVQKEKIYEIINSFNHSDLDELFSSNHDFAFQGGYAGFGLALMSTMDAESISWTNLLQI